MPGQPARGSDSEICSTVQSVLAASTLTQFAGEEINNQVAVFPVYFYGRFQIHNAVEIDLHGSPCAGVVVESLALALGATRETGAFQNQDSGRRGVEDAVEGIHVPGGDMVERAQVGFGVGAPA